MDLTETKAVVKRVRASCPQQHFDEDTPLAWLDLLDDLSYDDCLTAVKNLGKRQVFMAPAEIIAEVHRLRAERIDRTGPLPAPPADLTPPEVVAYRRSQLRLIAGGFGIERALPAGPLPGDPRPEFTGGLRELRANAAADRAGRPRGMTEQQYAAFLAEESRAARLAAEKAAAEEGNGNAALA